MLRGDSRLLFIFHNSLVDVDVVLARHSTGVDVELLPHLHVLVVGEKATAVGVLFGLLLIELLQAGLIEAKHLLNQGHILKRLVLIFVLILQLFGPLLGVLVHVLHLVGLLLLKLILFRLGCLLSVGLLLPLLRLHLQLLYHRLLPRLQLLLRLLRLRRRVHLRRLLRLLLGFLGEPLISLLGELDLEFLHVS